MLRVDWKQAWFAPWAAHGEGVVQRWHASGDLPQALNSFVHPNALRFVAQDALSPGAAYEAFIDEQQRIPTRNNAHDFFNGLCWLRFPKTKRRLNRLQAQAIQAHGIQAQRGALRDAITLMDENAVLLCAPELVWQTLQAKDWQSLFGQHREVWQHVHVNVFGHALLEKLLTPYKGITGHVLCLPMPESLITQAQASDAALDDWLSSHTTAEWLQTKPFTPLPILGVPGWWTGNENPDFYADKKVFRD